MEEKFEYLYSFKYKNKEYIYLVSKNYPFYFLEYNTFLNKFDYPDMETFKELYNKFNTDILTFDVKYELKKIKDKLSKKKFELSPLIKTTSGLISLALALSLSGCNQTKDITPSITPETSVSIEMSEKEQEIYNYFKKYDMDVVNREYDGNDYIFVNEYINSKEKKQITLHTFEEFRKNTKLNFVPTWEDVINAFKNNPNIDADKLSIILDGIDNMKNSEELKNIDLSVLFINAQKMKFKYSTSEEMINTVNRESVYAYFDVVSKTVYLPSDKPLKQFEFIHEVLGHGTLSYREETEDSLIVFDCTNYLMLLTDNRYTGHSVGTVISEGGANMIAHLATKDYTVNTFYELYEEELRVIAELCNISIGELFNYKGISFYDLMYQNGINTPVEYIFKMDGIFKGQLYCEFSYLMERLFIDATEEKILNSNEIKQDEIITATVEIIKDSYFKDKKELNFDYVGGTINYNFEESANKYEESINNLRGSK